MSGICLIRSVVLVILILACGISLADVGSLQVELAARGRFDELERLMEKEEVRHPLSTKDRHALCFAYSKIKRYDKLLPCLNLLEQNVRKGDLPTRLFGLDDATPAIHIMRAEALIELGQYGSATLEATTGLDWLHKEQSDDQDMEINCLAALSTAATLSGDREAGKRYAKEIYGLRSSNYANARAMALGRVYIALGEYSKALDGINSDSSFKLRVFLDNLVSGAMLSGESNWIWVELPRAFMINKALLELGRLDEAKSGYDKLLVIPQIQVNGEIYWLLLDDLGRIAEKVGDINSAIDYYKRAVAVIEQQRATINTEANKIGFVGDKQALYGRLIAALYRAERRSEAFEFMERAKARALVDVLAGKDNFVVSGVVKEKTLKLLKSYQEADRDARVQLPIDMRHSEVGTQRVAAVGTTIRQLREVAPELASLVSVSPVSVANVQQLLSPKEVMLEYYMRGEDLYVAAVSRGGIRVVRLEARGLEEQVRKFRKQIESQNPEILDIAKGMYNRLLRPLEQDFAEKNLLIIPHGVLHYLPISALHDGKAYVVENRAVHYLPSAGVMKYLRPQRSVLPESILVFGNPDLGNPQLDLPSAEKEASIVAQSISHSKLLVRDKATKLAFMQFAPKFPYLHVASHGQFEADNPLASRLLLSGENGGDGSLTAGDLYTIRLDADLVTLSACETGLGKVLNGDDIIGLTRGFLFAGSSNVIASLWEVDDAATSELMQAFYRNLTVGKSKLESLRDAQRKILQKYKHPFFWAAFVLTGNEVL